MYGLLPSGLGPLKERRCHVSLARLKHQMQGGCTLWLKLTATTVLFTQRGGWKRRVMCACFVLSCRACTLAPVYIFRLFEPGVAGGGIHKRCSGPTGVPPEVLPLEFNASPFQFSGVHPRAHGVPVQNCNYSAFQEGLEPETFLLEGVDGVN